MAIKVSTGLRNGALSTGSVKSLMDGGKIKIYSGPVPATADAAIGSATLLCTVSLDSTATGVNFDTAAANGVLSKAPGQVWSGVNSNTGTPTWYRHVTSADDGTESTTAYRIQGTVGVAGADLNLSINTLTAGATQTIDYYSIAWPTL